MDASAPVSYGDEIANARPPTGGSAPAAFALGEHDRPTHWRPAEHGGLRRARLRCYRRTSAAHMPWKLPYMDGRIRSFETGVHQHKVGAAAVMVAHLGHQHASRPPGSSRVPAPAVTGWPNTAATCWRAVSQIVIRVHHGLTSLVPGIDNTPPAGSLLRSMPCSATVYTSATMAPPDFYGCE
jgi:hypothetical protein